MSKALLNGQRSRNQQTTVVYPELRQIAAVRDISQDSKPNSRREKHKRTRKQQCTAQLYTVSKIWKVGIVGPYNECMNNPTAFLLQ